MTAVPTNRSAGVLAAAIFLCLAFGVSAEPADTLAPPTVDTDALTARIGALVNTEREKAGLRPLAWNEGVAEAARMHSRHLAPLNSSLGNAWYLDHHDGRGRHPERLKSAGVVDFAAAGENLAGVVVLKGYVRQGGNILNPVYRNIDEMAVAAVSGWMNSDRHRKNVLTGVFNETGIGIAASGTGLNFVIVQVFIQRVGCGYDGGPCCEVPAKGAACYSPYSCRGGICR
jgi:uncharacterized protein YkwD